MTKTKIAIIVAGGKGLRMQADIPKQFIAIKGKPILMHTLEVFHRYDPSIQLLLVLPTVQIDYWKELCVKYFFNLPHQIITGGETRFNSVKNGLDAIKSHSLVAVHDGVRPFVSIPTIKRCFDTAEEFGSAIPVVNMEESIRQISGDESQSVDRTSFKLVQTPQVFDSIILKKAYEQNFSTVFTDDASVVEAAGSKIYLVEGNRENIKITTGFDLELAEILCNSKNLNN